MDIDIHDRLYGNKYEYMIYSAWLGTVNIEYVKNLERMKEDMALWYLGIE